MGQDFCTIFSTLEAALANVTNYAQHHNQDIFITFTRYGRAKAWKYEFRFRLRSDIIGEIVGMFYLCKPNGDIEKLDTSHYELDEAAAC